MDNVDLAVYRGDEGYLAEIKDELEEQIERTALAEQQLAMSRNVRRLGALALASGSIGVAAVAIDSGVASTYAIFVVACFAMSIYYFVRALASL